jgi:hypothetical protein
MRLDVDFLNTRPPPPAALGRTRALTQMLAQEWPQGEEYACGTPAVYLSGLAKLSALRPSPMWIVRDGELLLEEFQRRVPSPEGSLPRLLIRKELARAVTPAWRKHFCTYRLTHSRQPFSKPCNGVLISVGREDVPPARAFLRRLETLLLRRASSITRAFIIYGDRNAPSAIVHKAVQSALKRAGASRTLETHSVHWQSLGEIFSLDRLWLLEAHDLQLLGDPFMTHYLLAKGARVFDPPGRGPVLQLSHRHGMILEPIHL